LGHYRRFIGVFAAKRKARFHAERQQLQFAYIFGQMAQRANRVATSNSQTFAPDTIESRLQTASHGLVKVYNGSTISDLTKFGLTMEEIYRFVAPCRTLARRVSKGEPLTVPISRQDLNDTSLTRKSGSELLADNSGCLIRVPSAIMSEAMNILINPRHAGAGRLTIEKAFDIRSTAVAFAKVEMPRAATAAQRCHQARATARRGASRFTTTATVILASSASSPI
jgi:hypothetical protein